MSTVLSHSRSADQSGRFAAVNLDKTLDVPGYPDVVEKIAKDDHQRADFLKACMLKLGLRVTEEQNAVPSLSRLHLSSIEPLRITSLKSSLKEITVIHDDEEYIQDENDTFHIEKPSAWSLGKLAAALPSGQDTNANANDENQETFVDHDTVVKRLIMHEKEPPLSKETPYFSHAAFYGNLKHYQAMQQQEEDGFGKLLLYGEVVTSTNTMLEKYGSPKISCMVVNVDFDKGILNCFDAYLAVSRQQQQPKWLAAVVVITSG